MTPEELMNNPEDQELIKKSRESTEPSFDLTQYLEEQEEKFIARQKELHQEKCCCR